MVGLAEIMDDHLTEMSRFRAQNLRSHSGGGRGGGSTDCDRNHKPKQFPKAEGVWGSGFSPRS